MRIGIDCRLWNETGVGRYIRNLVQNLAVLDRRNKYVLFLGDKDAQNLKSTNKDWKIVNTDIRWHSIEEQIKFPSILNKENLDLVHFPYFSVPIFYNKPYVVTIHDLIINHFPTGRATTLPWSLYHLKRIGYKIVLGQALKKARRVITVSEATKKEIIDHFGVNPSKIVVTYESGELEVNNQQSPASPSARFDSARREAGRATINNQQLVGKPYLLYVGNAHPHKNLERLLQAFKKVKSQNLKLVLVGKDGYFYQRLKRRVKEIGLKDQVVFYGEANDKELMNLYQHAQALVLPSLMEGFGLPGLEAMSQGCLVLASDIPALRETCGEAAIYFDPLNIEDIAEKIRKVCYHDLPARFAARRAGKAALNHTIKIQDGRERAKMFSWGKMAKETLKVYNAS